MGEVLLLCSEMAMRRASGESHSAFAGLASPRLACILWTLASPHFGTRRVGSPLMLAHLTCVVTYIMLGNGIVRCVVRYRSYWMNSVKVVKSIVTYICIISCLLCLFVRYSPIHSIYASGMPLYSYSSSFSFSSLLFSLIADPSELSPDPSSENRLARGLLESCPCWLWSSQSSHLYREGPKA
jgi:hypothetical protein